MGVLVATALPPVHFYPGLAGFGLFLALSLRPAAGPLQAFRRGTAFGMGFFLVGLYWVGIAFFADAEQFGAYAVPAVLMLCLILALTKGIAAALVAARPWRRLEAMALAFAVAWTGAELVRDLGFQFPWNPIAVVWAGTDLTLQAVAWVGTYGLSLLTVAAAGWTATLRPDGLLSRPASWLVPAVGVASIVAVGAFRLPDLPAPLTEDRVRVVQANMPQHHKWDPEARAGWFRRHLEMSAAAHNERPLAVVWPESAVPYEIEAEAVVRDYLAGAAPPGGFMIVGGDRFLREPKPPVLNNSLFVLDAGGTVRHRYDKVNLVPFGEFMPFRRVLRHLGLRKLTQGTIDFRPGPGRETITVPGLPPFSALICYEAAFAGRATADGDRPAWLVNITNDAWFGTSSGPFQHLAMARMRAVEEGLPLVRAANTGISVVTDPYGRILARLGLNEAGTIDQQLPAPLPAPSFARAAGAMLLLGLVLAVAVAAALIERGAGSVPVRSCDARPTGSREVLRHGTAAD